MLIGDTMAWPDRRSGDPKKLKAGGTHKDAANPVVGARRFGVSNSAVSQWESSESQMSGPAVKLLEVFEKRAAKFDET